MTVVVLGGGIKDGKLPLQAKKRLDKAIKISETRDIDRFLVCGKYSFLTDKNDLPEKTEAEIMKEYLLNEGVDSNKIFTEKESMDTISNAYYAKTEYFLPQNETEGIIITSEYHIPRVKYIFEKIFGNKFDLKFEGVETKADDRLLKRQQELLNKFKELTSSMEDGDHNFFKGKFFNIDYYTEKRPAWIKKKTSKG